jgi:tetratricopeptide (TPR) repeat protein
MQAFDAAAEYQPNIPQRWMDSGWAKTKLGRYKESLDDFERAKHLNGTSGMASYCLGVVHMKMGNYKSAIPLLLEFTRMDKTSNPSPWGYLSVAYKKLGRNSESRHAKLVADQNRELLRGSDTIMIEQCEWMDPPRKPSDFLHDMERSPDPGYWYWQDELGKSYVASRDFSHAAQVYERLIEGYHRDMSYWDVAITLGLVYEELRRPGDAMKAYKKAVEISPTSVEPRFLLSVLAIRQGDQQVASHTLKEIAAGTMYSDTDNWLVRSSDAPPIAEEQESADGLRAAIRCPASLDRVWGY